jgi:hypothetical protein
MSIVQRESDAAVESGRGAGAGDWPKSGEAPPATSRAVQAKTRKRVTTLTLI